jgi:uncharacterized protein YraI
MIHRSLVTAALGMGLAMGIPAVAHAYTTYTNSAVNLRAGPGTGFASYGLLAPGASVNVRYCQAGWCRASSYLGSGWVASSYLGGGPRMYPRPYPYYRPYAYGPRPYYRPYSFYRPYPYYRPYYGYPRSGFSFYFRWP